MSGEGDAGTPSEPRSPDADQVAVGDDPPGRAAGAVARRGRIGGRAGFVGGAVGLALLAGLVWRYVVVDAPREAVVDRVPPAESSAAADLQRARTAADRATVALLLDQGMVSAAASLAAENPHLGGPFRENVELARYETSVLIHISEASAEHESGAAEPTGEMPSDIDDFLPYPDGAFVATQGRYAGVYALAPAADGVTATACGEDTGSTNLLRPPSDPSLVLWDDDHIEHRNLPDCRSLVHRVPRERIPLREKETISTAVALDGETWAAIGTTEGRVLSIVREGALPLFSRGRHGAVRSLVAGQNESQLAVLFGDGSLALIRSDGKEATAPIPFVREGVVETKDPVWLDFIAHLPRSRRVASLSYSELSSRIRSPMGLLSFTNDRAGRGLIGRFFGEISSFADESRIRGPLAAREVPAREPDSECARLEWITSTRLRSVALERSCDEDSKEFEASLPSMLISAAAFCGSSPALVMGTGEGDLLFARLSDRRPPILVTLEHRERDWPDWITSVTCDDAGVVYASYASTGIKTFSSPFRMTNECSTRLSTAEGGGGFADDEMDRSWPVSVDGEPATLSLTASSGQMSLLRGQRTIWLRHVASPAPYRTADQRDFVSDVAIDDTRSRVWVLTSRGRLFVLDLASGANLATLETYFYRASWGQDTPFSGLKIDPGTGNVEFWAYAYACPEESELHTIISVRDVRAYTTGSDRAANRREEASWAR